MKNIHIALLLLITFSFSACDKYLDIKPKGYVIPQTVEDFERILNGSSLTKILSDGMEKLSDDFYAPTIVKGNNILSVDYNLYFWNPDIYTTVSDLTYYSFWNMLYSRVYQYNAVINGMSDATGGTDARKKAAIAQAKIGRAYCYYYLINLYSKPYNSQTATTDIGIPLVTSSSITATLPNRGTVRKSIDFILKDFNEAIPDLPTSAVNVYQITKGAGYGYLARLYITMGEYTKAADAADKALAFNDRLVDYNNEYQEITAANGVKFITAKSTSTFSRALTQPENIYVQFYDYTRGMLGANIAKQTQQLFDATDLRRINVVPSSRTLTTAQLPAWDGTYLYMGFTGFEYSIGIASPEMYLIRAEGNARDGKIQLAMDDLNKLRKNRFKPADFVLLTATDKIDATKKVLEERRRELLFKAVRWFDMRRLNSDPNFGFTAKHYFADGTFVELAPNSDRYVLRIPDTAINPDITQNP